MTLLEQAEEEYRRLLYVAMTRARDHLIVCGYRSNKKPSPNWHDMVKEALDEDLHEAELLEDNAYVRNWLPKDMVPEKQLTASKKPTVQIPTDQLPGWLNHRLAPEKKLPRPLNPSGAQALIDESLAQEVSMSSILEISQQQSAEFFRRRGTAIHKLLQVLPELDESSRWQKADHYLAVQMPELSYEQKKETLDAIDRTLTAKDLAPYFDPTSSRAEVPLMGRIDLANGPRSVSGTVDRMAVLDDEVMLLDYKTSLNVPNNSDDLAPDYLTQMALYRALVQKLYPDFQVKTALIWTHAANGPKLMKLDNKKLDEAYQALSRL